MKNPVVRFLVYSFSLYLLWYVFYELWLHPARYADEWLVNNIGDVSEWFLELLGFTLIKEFPVKDVIRTIGIDGTTGVWIGDPCNGLTLFALFAGFVIAYPGQLKIKLWFIPSGILSIHVFNIIRVIGLCIIQSYDYTLLDFNHTYTFTTVMYLYIFGLWYWWIARLNKPLQADATQN